MQAQGAVFYRLLGAYLIVITRRLLDDSSNTTVNITACIILNISCDVLFYKMVHFVIIISISKVFQVKISTWAFYLQFK